MVYQSFEKECGKACIRDLLFSLYDDSGFKVAEIREDCHDFDSMQKELQGWKADYEGYEVKDLDSLTKANLPAICQVRNGDVSHFVLVKKITKKKVFYDDPQFGPLSLKKNSFSSLSTGKFLIRKNSQKKQTVEKSSLLKTSEKLLYLALFVLETISFLLLGYMLNDERPIQIIIAFGILSLFFVFLQILYNFRLRKKLNSRVLLPYMKVSKEKEDYSFLSKVIALTISNYSTLLSYCVLTVFLLFLLLANGVYLTILALMSIIFGLLRVERRMSKGNYDRVCSQYESSYLKSLKGVPDEKAFTESDKKAKDFLFSFFALYVVGLSAIGSALFVIMYLNENVTLNYFLFHFALCLTIAHGVEKMFQTIYEEEKRVSLINSLSMNLPHFLLNKGQAISYTSNTNKTSGGEDDGEREHTDS